MYAFNIHQKKVEFYYFKRRFEITQNKKRAENQPFKFNIFKIII